MTEADSERYASIRASMLASATKQVRELTYINAAQDAADANGSARSSQTKCVPGDLSSIYSRSDMKVLEHLRVYEYLSQETLINKGINLNNVEEHAYRIAAWGIGETSGMFKKHGCDVDTIIKDGNSVKKTFDIHAPN